MNVVAAIHRGLEALKIGKSLLHVEAWKNAQIVGSLLVALAAVARACGVDFGIDDSTLAAIGVGIAALVNSYLTLATSKKVGIATPEDGSPSGEPRHVPPLSIPKEVNPSPKPPADFNSQLYVERMHDGRYPSVDRRGLPAVETLPTEDGKPLRFRESDVGWNDR